MMINPLKVIPAAALGAAGLLFLAAPCAAETLYMIGNSFTYCSQPYSLAALSGQQSVKLEVGAHIKSGSPVHNIWGNPDNARELSTEYGKFREALKKHQWDAVTLQPFYKRPYGGLPRATMQTDIDSILNFIKLARENPANKDTKFYIYASWPFLWTGKPLQESWDRVTVDNLETPSSHQRTYYEHLVKRLRGVTDAEIRLIPIPEVMYELDKRMRAGEVPGLSGIGDIMGDKLHLDAGLGGYLAGVTVYSTISGKNPAGLAKPLGHYEGKEGNLITPEVAKIVNDRIAIAQEHEPF